MLQENGGSSHLIDSIVDCRRTPAGDYRFQVSMECGCCKGRDFWLSEAELKSIGAQDLLDQAQQAIDFLFDGVGICKGLAVDANFEDINDDFAVLGQPQYQQVS